MMSTPTFLPHSSPIVHRPEVKEVVERKYLLNKDSLSLHVYLSPFHPCPPAMMFFACARGGRGERERSPFGTRPTSRRVGPRSNLSLEAEQVHNHAPGALASSRPSASSPVPASSACPNTSASLASLHVPASLARPGVPALSACPDTSALSPVPASAPVPALSACPHATASSHHVGAGSNISREAEQGCDRAPGRDGRQTGQGRLDLAASVNGSFPTTYAEDRDGNSRASSFCLFST
jgi:hypothetical protein